MPKGARSHRAQLPLPLESPFAIAAEGSASWAGTMGETLVCRDPLHLTLRDRTVLLWLRIEAWRCPTCGALTASWS